MQYDNMWQLTVDKTAGRFHGFSDAGIEALTFLQDYFTDQVHERAAGASIKPQFHKYGTVKRQQHIDDILADASVSDQELATLRDYAADVVSAYVAGEVKPQKYKSVDTIIEEHTADITQKGVRTIIDEYSAILRKKGKWNTRSEELDAVTAAYEIPGHYEDVARAKQYLSSILDDLMTVGSLKRHVDFQHNTQHEGVQKLIDMQVAYAKPSLIPREQAKETTTL